MKPEEIISIVKGFNYNIDITNGLLYLNVNSNDIYKVLFLLKNNKFEVLIDCFAMPTIENNNIYTIFYHLINYKENERICISTNIHQINLNYKESTSSLEVNLTNTTANSILDTRKINNNKYLNSSEECQEYTKYYIQSVIDIFPNANWYEREIYEMYNITFIGHKNLTKLFND